LVESWISSQMFVWFCSSIYQCLVAYKDIFICIKQYITKTIYIASSIFGTLGQSH